MPTIDGIDSKKAICVIQRSFDRGAQQERRHVSQRRTWNQTDDFLAD
jgi:hypothetical protein